MSIILHSPLLLHKPLLISSSKYSRFYINSCTQSSDDTSSTVVPPPKNPNSTGLGFGSSSSTSNSNPQKKQKGKRERGSVIRRAPVETPKFIAKQEDDNKLKEQGKNEQAFLLTWLGLGSLIFVQGILLSVSGFLPEELDNLCVKYVYPSFTPTVVFFFAGTVVYGVSKYLQNEEANKQN